MTKISTLGGVVKTKKADGRVIHWDARDAVAFWSAKEYSGAGNLKNLARSDGLHDLVNNGAKFLPFDGEKYVYLPGVLNNYVGSPDPSAFDLANDFDIRVHDVHATLPVDQKTLFGKYQSLNDGSFVFQWNSDGTLRLAIVDPGVTLSGANATVGTGVLTGESVRATWRKSDDRLQFFKASNENGPWTQLGTNLTLPAVRMAASSTELKVGGWGGTGSQGGAGFLGSIGKAEIRNGIDGPIVASWSAEDMAQTGGVSGGRTWTINRTTTGLKSVLVDRPLFLLGTDDYLETPDHADFDFGAGDSFSVVTVFRQHHNPATPGIGAYISKATSALRGWRLWQWHNDQAIYFTINDGTINAQDNQTPPALNTAAIRAGVRNAALDTLKTSVDGVSSGTTPDTTTDTLVNAKAVRIGSDPDTTNYSDREFMGAAIFRRALTDAEILEVGETLGAG